VLAERVTFAAEGLVRIPEEFGFEEAATFPCAAVTAWNALRSCAHPLTEDDVVLCLGSGGVSVFALQIAKLAGARTIATSSSPKKLDRLRALGADEVVNYVRTPAWDAVVRELTGGRGADFVIEVGGAETLARSLRACARGGVVTMIGVLSGRAVNADATLVYGNELTLRGVYVGPRTMLEKSLRAFAEAGERPVIDRVYAFEDVPAAYQHLRSGEHLGKVVVGL
jgi:NADPH:quinone reductase-like Zn-dependent oxidoreductase